MSGSQMKVYQLRPRSDPDLNDQFGSCWRLLREEAHINDIIIGSPIDIMGIFLYNEFSLSMSNSLDQARRFLKFLISNQRVQVFHTKESKRAIVSFKIINRDPLAYIQPEHRRKARISQTIIQPKPTPIVSVFVDTVNIYRSCIDMHARIPIKQILYKIRSMKLGQIRGYAMVNSGCPIDVQTAYRRSGFLIVACPPSKYDDPKREDRIDEEINIRSLQFTTETDVYFFVSEDGDFLKVINHLRNIGKKVFRVKPSRKETKFLITNDLDQIVDSIPLHIYAPRD